jgi:DNA polymerase
MSLDLDLRQRAMLQEMQVKVWWPLTRDAQPLPVEAPAQLATRPATKMEPDQANAPKAQQMVAPQDRGSAPASVTSPPSAVTVEAAVAPRIVDLQRLDWRGLQQAVADCRACALSQGRQHAVFGVGGLAPQALEHPPVVDWLIVGEAPGEQEDLRGEPFVGPAGQLLDNMLRAIGLDRHRQSAPTVDAVTQSAQGCFIANVLKCRPPANRNPEGAEVAQCMPFLQRQIELLQPKIILAMGRFAAQTLLHDSLPDVHGIPLGKLRGKVHQYRGIPVVVTYHPAYLLRALGDKAKAWADLCLAVQVRKEAG